MKGARPMAKEYSSAVCRRLADVAEAQRLHRPGRLTRHEAGDRLDLDLTGVAPVWRARACFEVERYVGGGFAGQVYRARVVRIEAKKTPGVVSPQGPKGAPQKRHRESFSRPVARFAGPLAGRAWGCKSPAEGI